MLFIILLFCVLFSCGRFAFRGLEHHKNGLDKWLCLCIHFQTGGLQCSSVLATVSGAVNLVKFGCAQCCWLFFVFSAGLCLFSPLLHRDVHLGPTDYNMEALLSQNCYPWKYGTRRLSSINQSQDFIRVFM